LVDWEIRCFSNAYIITDDDLISYDESITESEDLINVCKGPFEICGRPDDKFTLVPEKAMKNII
jgi:hypothetical protein